MSNKSERMAQLARSIGASSSPEPVGAEKQQAVKREKQQNSKTARRGSPPRLVVRPDAGARDERIRMTVRFDAETRARLLRESMHRKDRKAERWAIQDIIEESVRAHLGEK